MDFRPGRGKLNFGRGQTPRTPPPIPLQSEEEEAEKAYRIRAFDEDRAHLVIEFLPKGQAQPAQAPQPVVVVNQDRAMSGSAQQALPEAPEQIQGELVEPQPVSELGFFSRVFRGKQ